MKGSEKVTRRQRKKGKGRYHMHLLSNVGRWKINCYSKRVLGQLKKRGFHSYRGEEKERNEMCWARAGTWHEKDKDRNLQQ
jgi:hypothetical protein